MAKKIEEDGGRRGTLWARTGLVLFVAGGLLGLWRLLPESRKEREPVRVELSVEGHLSPEQLWALAGLPGDGGQPCDPDLVCRSLEKTALVESVAPLRPGDNGAVRYLVRERKPMAGLVCPASGVELSGGEVSMVLDGSGVAVPATSFAGMEAELKALPRVQVLKIVRFAPGVRLESPAVETAVAVLAGVQKLPGLPAVREIRQVNDYSITVDFQGELAVQFAFDDPGGQLQKLHQLQSYAERMNRKLKTVNLVLRRNIPVTFAGEMAEEFRQKDVQP